MVQVSGLPVEEAMAQLYFSKKRHSADLQQVSSPAPHHNQHRMCSAQRPAVVVHTVPANCGGGW